MNHTEQFIWSAGLFVCAIGALLINSESPGPARKRWGIGWSDQNTLMDSIFKKSDGRLRKYLKLIIFLLFASLGIAAMFI